MIKNGLHATGIQRLPTGRGIACKINGIHMINIYTPSGAERRKERESFFNGDFNCIIKKDESTDNRNISSALEKLIRGYKLQDAWGQTAGNRGYTYYNTTGASRLDRIYISQRMLHHKKGMEIHAAAFADHMAVTIHLASNLPLKAHGRGLWCMNMTMLQDNEYMGRVRELWAAWHSKQKYYPSIVLWWERCIKRNLRLTNMRYGSEKKKRYKCNGKSLLRSNIQHNKHPDAKRDKGNTPKTPESKDHSIIPL
jgi:hypothetical protein